MSERLGEYQVLNLCYVRDKVSKALLKRPSAYFLSTVGQ